METVVSDILSKCIDVNKHEVDIITNALLDRAANDDYFAYKKIHEYDELIDEWVLPVVGE